MACVSRVEYLGLLCGRGGVASHLVLAPGGCCGVEAPEVAESMAPLWSAGVAEPLVVLHTHPLGARPSMLDEYIRVVWGLPLIIVWCGGWRSLGVGGVEWLGYSCSVTLLDYNPRSRV